MKRFLLAAALTLAAGPALAMHCPADIAKIDAALAADTSLSAETRVQVQALRDQGAELHAAGQHQASIEVLTQAMALLGIQ